MVRESGRLVLMGRAVAVRNAEAHGLDTVHAATALTAACSADPDPTAPPGDATPIRRRSSERVDANESEGNLSMHIDTSRSIPSLAAPAAVVPPNRMWRWPRSLRSRPAGWLGACALACAGLFVAPHVQAQATFASGSNDATLLTNMQGSGVTLSNATLAAGDRPSQVGVFSNGIAGAGLQVDNGVIFATGSVAESFSTNNATQSTINAPGPANFADPQLVSINANATFDAVVYSFDATLQPGFTALQATFQFGSDEYPDYVGSQFNDAFGFFISGPGITGWRNVALAPGSSDPITINTINAGFLGCSQDGTPANLTRAAQYINNGHSATGAACNTNPGPFPVVTEYNGLTRRLTVTLPALQTGVAYRFKIAIADTGDASLDSAVFIDQIAGIATPSITLNKVTQGGAGGPFGFALTNTIQTTGTVTTSVAGTPTQVDGNTGTAGLQPFVIAAMGTPVTINENSLPAGWSLAGATCVNQASATVGSRSGSVYTISAAEIDANTAFTCTFTNTRNPILRLQKALPQGRFVAADQFALNIAGPGGPASVTTTGSGTTATGIATLNPATIGSPYTFSETAAAGANLANYATTYSCANALSGGQTPSGNGTSFNLTPVAGDDLTCTLTNTRNPLADLRLTKTNTPGVNAEVDQVADTVVSGAASSYAITVTNNGPDAANGTVVTDPVPTNLSCATATCTAAGGAACPAQTGAALVAALQGAGATVPTLPNGGSVTFTLNCTVQ
jgi:uncharacterized repeat protein (TIGR01451 family)